MALKRLTFSAFLRFSSVRSASRMMPASRSWARLVPWRGMLGGEPSVAIKKGEIGEGGIGNEPVLYNDDFIAIVLLGYQGVERTSVCALIGVVDIIILYHLEGMNLLHLVGGVLDGFHALGAINHSCLVKVHFLFWGNEG